MAQGQEQRVLLRAFRRLCGVRLDTAVGIRQAQPPHGYPVLYRLHLCSATEHSHRRAALKPFSPAIRAAVYAQVSTPTIYIDDPAARCRQCSGKTYGCGSAEFRGNPNSRKLPLQLATHLPAARVYPCERTFRLALSPLTGVFPRRLAAASRKGIY